MLKKQACYLIAIVSAMLLFLGCSSIWDAMSTVKVEYDPDLPKEQSTVITFDSTIKVLQYNGTDVKDTWYPKGKERINKVTLPAGPAAIILNYLIQIQEGDRITSIKRNNLELRFDFEVEKEYAVGAWVLRGESKGFLQGNKWTYGIGVWAKFGDVGEKDKAIKYWELGEK
jgi:hypothetical protein